MSEEPQLVTRRIWDLWGYWRYYCWLCNQWTQDRGPWCELYKSEPRTDRCYWDELESGEELVPRNHQ